ncbi:MAG: hypothetical protein HW411_1654 [Gammaproteobacteria bacterium]|nr:hypothetical protein [Gammaproteobacteria bacterium]
MYRMYWSKNYSFIFDTSAIYGGRQISCSCIICTSAVHGGRMPVLQDDYMDAVG